MTTVRALACASLLVALLFASASAARADVIGPPEEIQCAVGQVATTDHGGTHCEQIHCQTSAECPQGLVCQTRNECQCDPRGAPCSCYDVARCQPAGSSGGGGSGGGGDDRPVAPGASGSTSRPRGGCMCEAPGARHSVPAWPGLALAAAVATASIARRRRRR